MMHPVDLSKIQRWFNGTAFLWSLEKTWFCDKQSIKPVNEDDPELKNKLQLNILKADITVTSKLEMISSSWISIRKIMAVGSDIVGSKYMDKKDNKTQTS